MNLREAHSGTSLSGQGNISNQSNFNTRTGTYGTIDNAPLNRAGRVEDKIGRNIIRESDADMSALNESLARNPNALPSVHQDAIASARATRAKIARFRNLLCSFFSESGRKALGYTFCKWLLTILKLATAVIALGFAVDANDKSGIVLGMLGIFAFATEEIIDSIENSE